MFRFQVIIKNENELHLPACSTRSTHELVEIKHFNQEKQRREDTEKALKSKLQQREGLLREACMMIHFTCNPEARETKEAVSFLYNNNWREFLNKDLIKELMTEGK